MNNNQGDKALAQQAADAIESGDPADAQRFELATGMPPEAFQAQAISGQGKSLFMSAVSGSTGDGNTATELSFYESEAKVLAACLGLFEQVPGAGLVGYYQVHLHDMASLTWEEKQAQAQRLFFADDTAARAGVFEYHDFESSLAVLDFEAVGVMRSGNTDAMERFKGQYGISPAAFHAHMKRGEHEPLLVVLHQAFRRDQHQQEVVAQIGGSASGPGQQGLSHDVQAIADRIAADIALLRSVCIEPVSIKFGTDIDVEVRPAGDDDRVLVGRQNWGYTRVNYTPDGLVLDVYAEGELNAAHAVRLEARDLESPGRVSQRDDSPGMGM